MKKRRLELQPIREGSGIELVARSSPISLNVNRAKGPQGVKIFDHLPISGVMEKSITSTAERRRYKRLAPLLKREEQVLIEKDNHWLSTTIVNLSAVGALLNFTETDSHLAVGETLNLFFDNGGQSIVIKAVVLRSDSGQIAFEFSDLSPDTKTAIQTKLIRMAIISERIMAIDGHEVPPESEIADSDRSLVSQECS